VLHAFSCGSRWSQSGSCNGSAVIGRFRAALGHGLDHDHGRSDFRDPVRGARPRGLGATTLDGYPMTKRGEAGRALGASYMSAMIGGLFGAALMGISLPLLRPVILFMGSPELLRLRCSAFRWCPRCRVTRRYAVSPGRVSASCWR